LKKTKIFLKKISNPSFVFYFIPPVSRGFTKTCECVIAVECQVSSFSNISWGE
jgi:hypothetical protein